MIHVCYGLHDPHGTYSKFVGTSILSMFENTREDVVVHVLTDDTLSNKNRDRFKALAENYGQTINLYDVEALCPEKVRYIRDKLCFGKTNSRFTVGTFYRLTLPEVLCKKGITDKVIYVDADTVVNLDVAGLWAVDLQGHPLAAVPELAASQGYRYDKYLVEQKVVAAADYFCAGVLVLDLTKFNDEFFYTGVDWLSSVPECECADQDILNNFYSEDYLHLPEAYNSLVFANRFLRAVVGRKIYHYAGREYCLSVDDVYDELLLGYFAKTPWFDAEVFDRFRNFKRVIREHDDFIESTWVNRLKLFTRSMKPGKRVFFVGAHAQDFFKELLDVRDDETFIVVSSDARTFLRVLNELKDLKRAREGTMFIYVEDFTGFKTTLEKLGYREWEHFVNLKHFEPARSERPKYDFLFDEV